MSDAANMQDIVVKRIVDAPVDLVWGAWTNPDHVKKWWGPQYYTSPSCTIDLRVGGQYVFSMKAPAEQGGMTSFTAGHYRKIEPNRLLEFTQYIADESGNALDPAAIGMPPDFPKLMTTSVEFEPKGELTRLVITVRGWTSGQMFVFALAGWHQQIDKLDELLSQN